MIEARLIVALVLVAGAAPADAAPCPGLIDHLEEHSARAATQWNPDPWEYSYRDTLVWTQGNDLKVNLTSLTFHTPLPGKELTHEWREADLCSLVVQKEFYVGSDTLATSFGRIPEECSEAPALIWQSPDQRRIRRCVV